MAQGDTQITFVGNLVADPELRLTPNGAAVANFRVASTPRRYDNQTGQWVDEEPTFLTCNAWRQLAQNAASSLTKGMRVIVVGRLKQRAYENQAGEKRSVFEIEVDEVAPSLRYATAQVMRSPQPNSSFGGKQPNSNLGQQGTQQPAQSPQNGVWGNQSQNKQNGPWGPAAGAQQPQQGGFQQAFHAQDEEPPF